MQAGVSKDDQAMASTGTSKTRGPKTIQGKVRTMTDPVQQKTMQEYESALKAMQEGKYDKARDIFR
jgi:TolA-binding protein